MKQYHPQLFWGGFLLNLLGKLPLIALSAVLCIIGIWYRPCLVIGIGVAAIAVLWSLLMQIMVKHTVEQNDDPGFEPFAAAMRSENWQEEMERVTHDRHSLR